MTVSTTYTLLVTIAHDEGAAPSTDLLDVMVQRGLEEGVREFAGVYSASVDCDKGDHVAAGPGTAMQRAKILHRELRAD